VVHNQTVCRPGRSFHGCSFELAGRNTGGIQSGSSNFRNDICYPQLEVGKPGSGKGKIKSVEPGAKSRYQAVNPAVYVIC
jgi:hypothetical protein